MRYIRLAIILLLAVSSIGQVTAAPSSQKGRETAVFFRKTQNWIAPPFYDFWDQNGGLPIFGYPLAPTDLMVSADDGNTYATQIFERNRLEYHPENPEPYRILLGRLGVEVLRQQGRNWEDFPKGQPKQGCDFFPETGHTLCEPFRSYWRSHGLDLGMRGIAYAESLALFGFPISEPMMETNAEGDTVLTQWFERVRFEFHPNNPPQYQVLLGLLGKELYGSYRPGVATVSGVAIANVIDNVMVVNPRSFWEEVNRSDSGVQITTASLAIVGPLYPSDHPLSGVADDWFRTLVDIQPDSTFSIPNFVPEVPGAIMTIVHGLLEGTCSDGRTASFSPYGSKDLPIVGGQPLENVEFLTVIYCS